MLFGDLQEQRPHRWRWSPDRRQAGEVRPTDAAGTFSSAASRARLDFFQSEDKYSISITEPVGDLVCGLDMESAWRHGRVFQNEPADSAGHRQRHYFPLAVVNDPGYPPPLPASIASLKGRMPAPVLFRKLDNPGQLRIELIPLLQNESECQGTLGDGGTRRQKTLT